jgi:hypothetical protein
MKHPRTVYALMLAGICVMALGAPVATAQDPPPIWHDGFPDPSLPPIHPDPSIAYYGHDLHAVYPMGVILRNPVHRAFTNVQRVSGTLYEMETFDSLLDGEVSIDGGGSWMSVTMSGPVTTMVNNYVSGQLGTFQTEILGMSLSANVGGMPVMIRESPTLSSTGRVSVEEGGGGGGGGGYRIESFFDVFTELSVDGGMTWYPDTEGPGRMTLCPEPASLVLLALGGLAMLRRRRA